VSEDPNGMKRGNNGNEERERLQKESSGKCGVRKEETKREMRCSNVMYS